MQPSQRALCFRYVFLVAVLLVATSCFVTPESEEFYTVVTPATLKPGAPIPLPQAEPILTVTGKIGASNSQDALLMDRTTIEQAGLVEYTVTDPFEQRAIRYQGVLMRDLLELWQVSADAETVELTALNDYQITIPIADFRQYPILFALQADGAYMQPDYRGPAMLVYPVDHYEFDLVAIQRNWIWQIKAIQIQ
jgi:hypothetical protein